MREFRPVYCKYCRQTLLSDNLEKCSGCGKVGGVMDPTAEPAVLADLVARKQAEPEPATETMGRGFGGALHFFGLLRLTLTGLVCLGLGLAVVLIPDLRDNPRTISGSDVARGIGASVVGFVVMGLVFFSTKRHQ